ETGSQDRPPGPAPARRRLRLGDVERHRPDRTRHPFDGGPRRPGRRWLDRSRGYRVGRSRRPLPPRREAQSRPHVRNRPDGVSRDLPVPRSRRSGVASPLRATRTPPHHRTAAV
ncbi:MAG: hypothetical protein AVDCRST_MAG04-1215, partial [uncultured Acetobacteraceae bacterium]